MMNKCFNLLQLVLIIFCQACFEDLGSFIPVHPSPPPTGIPTNVGEPVGEPVTQEVGPEGGTISWADGKFRLVFPQGALRNSTTITVQPISHTLDLALGTAFDFGPNGLNFQKPVEFYYQYTDEDLLGTSPEFVHIAFQDEKNIWQSMRKVEVNRANKTLKANLTHFSKWSFFASAMIRPGQKTLNVKQSVELEIVGYEYELSLKTDPKYWGLLSPLVPPSPIQNRLVKEWLIDGKNSGVQPDKGVIGSINNDLTKAQYTAPPSVPFNENVTISAELNLGKGKFLLLSTITIQSNNNYSVGPYSFSNVEVIIGRAADILTINMMKPNAAGYESSLAFLIPNFTGVGNYPFSLDLTGSIEIIGEDRSFSSIAYDANLNPFFNGKIQITESSNQAGGNIAGTMSGTLYEAVEKDGKTSYTPYPFQASFSSVFSF